MSAIARLIATRLARAFTWCQRTENSSTPQSRPSSRSSRTNSPISGCRRKGTAGYPGRPRLRLISPLTTATTTAPDEGESERSTTARSSSWMPAPIIDQPRTRQMKVAGGLGTSQRGSSSAPSMKSSAGLGNPAQSVGEHERDPHEPAFVRRLRTDPIETHARPPC